MPKHNEPQYKTKANAKGVIYAYTRVDGQQVEGVVEASRDLREHPVWCIAYAETFAPPAHHFARLRESVT